jgi:hypothetical protein
LEVLERRRHVEALVARLANQARGVFSASCAERLVGVCRAYLSPEPDEPDVYAESLERVWAMLAMRELPDASPLWTDYESCMDELPEEGELSADANFVVLYSCGSVINVVGYLLGEVPRGGSGAADCVWEVITRVTRDAREPYLAVEIERQDRDLAALMKWDTLDVAARRELVGSIRRRAAEQRPEYLEAVVEDYRSTD